MLMRNQRFFRAGLLAVLGWALSALAAASGPPSRVESAGAGGGASESVGQKAIRISYSEVESVRVVLLPASVEDRKGRAVRGLSQADFQLFDEGVPQQIQYFSVEGDEPVEVAFLLDVSGSMREIGKLEAAKEAIRHIAGSLRPVDRVALICFADDQVSWVTEFTTDRERFFSRLQVQEGYGQTAIHDALAAAPELVQAAANGRKAMVLITDGVDNASKLSVAEAIGLARSGSVPIYTVGLSAGRPDGRKKGEVPNTFQVLQEYSTETGGILFSVRDPDDLKEAAAQILEDLRHQYVIGYTPQYTVWDGRFRHVRLEAPRRRVAIRTRTGYFANP